jgi:hypothetical protein
MAKIFGGIGDNARARSMAQIQYDLHEGKSVVDTRETNARTTHRVAAETAGKVFIDDNGYKRGLQYKKSHDKWNAKFARDNKDLEDNAIYVGVGEVGPKGVKQQKAASVRYPDRNGNNTPTDGATTETVTDKGPNTPPPPGGGAVQDEINFTPPKGGAAKKTTAKKTAAKKAPAAKKAAALDSTPSSTPVSTSTNGAAQPELFPGYGPTFDGQGNNTQGPKSKPSAVKKPKAPKTPKAGA